MEGRVRHQVLTDITRVLMETSGAEAVLLFGSRARGDGTGHSDYDLCLIMPGATKPGSVDLRRLHSLVRKDDLSIGVVAITRTRYLEGSREINSLAHDVFSEGVVLAGSVDRTSMPKGAGGPP